MRWVCLVTEYCPQGSLDSVLAKLAQKFKEDPAVVTADVAFSDHSKNVLQYARDIAEGLSYLHHDCQPPVVHRDIKSGNMLISRENHIKICDFGSAALHRGGDMVTQAGTPQFAAPELIVPANRYKINEKCDIWSFACVLWHMITLASPHEDASHQFTALLWVGWGVREGQSNNPHPRAPAQAGSAYMLCTPRNVHRNLQMHKQNPFNHPGPSLFCVPIQQMFQKKCLRFSDTFSRGAGCTTPTNGSLRKTLLSNCG